MQTPAESPNFKSRFRGYAIPGPIPPGAYGNGPSTFEGETLDALCGHFKIFQLKKGHRFSTDDVLVAWYGTSCCASASRILDLGSGLGTIGMIAAWRIPGSQVITLEAQSTSIELARKSIEWNGLQNRFKIREGDFRDATALLPQEKFDLIFGSPPYFPLGTGVLGDHPQKIACRFETRGNILDYCKVASQHLNPGGWFACVFPVSPKDQKLRVEEAAHEAGLSIIRRRDVILREAELPLLGLFAMTRQNDVPASLHDSPWVEPPLTIRSQDGSVHPEYARIKLSFGFPP